MWQDAIHKFEYETRAKEILKFNTENQHVKRGMALIPSMYGVGFGMDFFQQVLTLPFSKNREYALSSFIFFSSWPKCCFRLERWFMCTPMGLCCCHTVASKWVRGFTSK